MGKDLVSYLVNEQFNRYYRSINIDLSYSTRIAYSACKVTSCHCFSSNYETLISHHTIPQNRVASVMDACWMVHYHQTPSPSLGERVPSGTSRSSSQHLFQSRTAPRAAQCLSIGSRATAPAPIFPADRRGPRLTRTQTLHSGVWQRGQMRSRQLFEFF